MHAVLEIPYGVHLSKFLSDDHNRRTPAMRDRGWERDEGNDDRPWYRGVILRMGGKRSLEM